MTGLEGLFVGLLAAGTAVDVVGRVNAAGAQADAAQAERVLKNEQAMELLSRQEINEKIMRDSAEQAIGEYQTSFASSGRGGGGLGGALRIKKDLAQNIMITRREAEFKASQLRKGADIEAELASSGIAAAWLGGTASVLKSGAMAYSLLQGKKTPGNVV